MLRLIMACFPLLVTVAMAAPVPKDAKKPVLYFPTKVGAKWVYEFQGGSTSAMTVREVEKGKDGAMLVTVVGMSGDEESGMRYKYEVSPKGLCKVAYGGHAYDPPIYDVNLMNEPGEKWENKATLQGNATNFGPRREAGIEEVQVPAGKFKALRVEHRRDRDSGDRAIHFTEWYAPGVGMVKLESTAKKYNYVLKSFTPGKD